MKLDQNESPFDLPSGIKEEVLRRLRQRPWNRYPAFETPALCEKLAGFVGVRPEQVLIAHGSNLILYSLADAVLDPGDKVVTSPPTFAVFDLVASVAGARIVAVPQVPDFQYDVEAMRREAREARLVMIASPNTPTGRSMRIEDLRGIAAAAKGIVLWDEAYHEFCGKSALPCLADHDNLLVLRTFSKAFGLAGVRLGYVVGNAELIQELRKVSVPFNVDCFSEIVLDVVLDRPESMLRCVRTVVQERERLRAELETFPGLKVFPSETNFLLFQVPDALTVYQQLLERGIHIRCFATVPDLEDCLRVTVGTRAENDLFLEALREVVGS